MLASRPSPRRYFTKMKKIRQIEKSDKVVVADIISRQNYYSAYEEFDQL